MTRWLWPSLAVTVAALAFSGYIYAFKFDDLPDKIPTHWDINFEPDKFSPKEDIVGSLLLMPLVMAGFVWLTVILPWLSPKPFAVDRFRDTYGYLMFLVTALFGYLHVTILLGSLGVPQFGRIMLAGILFFFALIGNQLGRTRRNFWMGVRTPWTLADENVWNRTHRLAGWLFVGYGLLGAVLVLAGWVPALWVFVALIAVVLVPVVYSLVIYKQLERQGRLTPTE
jgi:uncharacterized membrane protein